MHSTLYLDRRGLELSLQGKVLTLHHDGKYLRSIPLSLLDRIVCRASVMLKTSLLANLSQYGIGVTFFGGSKGDRSAHTGAKGTADVKRRIGQYRHYLNPLSRIDWSIRLVSHKLLRQKRLLRKILRVTPEQALSLTKAVREIGGLSMQLNDQAVIGLDTIRGIEGAAARSFFQAYAGLIPSEYGFSGRNRQPPRDPVNALLSLGYTLLHGDVRQVTESVGLDPSLGLYHEPTHGRDSLVCDLVEVYRHYVDEMVWELVRDCEIPESYFRRTGSACLLDKDGRAQFYPAYEAKVRSLRPRMRAAAMYVARAFMAGN